MDCDNSPSPDPPPQSRIAAAGIVAGIVLFVVYTAMVWNSPETPPFPQWLLGLVGFGLLGGGFVSLVFAPITSWAATRREHRDTLPAQAYAEQNNWLNLSKDRWTGYRGTITLVVHKSVMGGWLLTVDAANGVSATSRQFGSAEYALRFGDYVYRERLSQRGHHTSEAMTTALQLASTEFGNA